MVQSLAVDTVDVRLHRIVSALSEILRGNYGTRLPVEDRDSPIDAIHAAVNVVAEELGRKMRLSQQILGSMLDALIVCHPDGTIRMVNDEACRLFGRPSQDLVDRPLSELLASSAEAGDVAGPLLARLAGERSLRGLELTFHHQDGTPIPMAVNASLIRGPDEAPDGVLLVAHDVRELRQAIARAERAAAAATARSAELETTCTELARMQRQSRETQAKTIQSGKLAALGELAAGVAHELNNPLSGVLSYSVLLQEQIDELEPDLRDRLEDFSDQLKLIRSAAERCKAIADNLLTFARQSDAEMGPISIARVVRDTFQLIGAVQRSRRVTLEIDVASELEVWGNGSQLQQVVTNITVNAIQVMSPGGKLVLRGTGDERWVTLEISDTGPGIPAEHLPKIFDPFFTTKPIGMGTGLGLSIAYGIVRGHGGDLSARSVVGQGATFTIRLPTLVAEPPVLPPREPVEEQP